MGMARAVDAAREAHLAIDLAGTGRVIAQEPAPGARVNVARGSHAATRVMLRFSDGNSPAPRVSGGAP
jgi:hypothetical protein